MQDFRVPFYGGYGHSYGGRPYYGGYGFGYGRRPYYGGYGFGGPFLGGVVGGLLGSALLTPRPNPYYGYPPYGGYAGYGGYGGGYGVPY